MLHAKDYQMIMKIEMEVQQCNPENKRIEDGQLICNKNVKTI